MVSLISLLAFTGQPVLEKIQIFLDTLLVIVNCDYDF